MDESVESGFAALKDTVDKFMKHSGYLTINLAELFSFFVSDASVEEEDDYDDSENYKYI